MSSEVVILSQQVEIIVSSGPGAAIVVTTAQPSEVIVSQGGTVIFNSFGGDGAGAMAISAGSRLATTGTVQFADSNGMSFGMDGNSRITGSFSQSVQPISFANSNGISFGVNGSTVTGSVKTDYLTTAAQVNHSHAFSAAGGSSAFQTLTFANSNGVYFSNSNGSLVASVDPPPAQTEQTQNRFNMTLSGLTAGVMALVSSGIITLAATNNITLSQNGNSVVISGPNTHAQQTGISGISAGTTQATDGTVVFSNSNGISFALNGRTLTASHNGLTTAAQSNHSHGNPSLALTNLSGTTASASNGLTISLSAAAPGGGGGAALSAGASSQNTGTIVLSNSNGLSFGLNAGTLTASHNGLTTAALSNHSHGNPSLALTNLSGTTASNSAGLTISLSAAAGGGGADGYNIVGVNGNTIGSALTVQFSNSNNVSFGINGSTITATASYPAQTVQPVAYSAVNGSALFSTLTFANSNGVSFSSGTQGVYATVKTDYAASNVTTANVATSQSSLFQHTSATSAITANAFPAANSTNLLGSGYTTHTHTVPAQTVQPVAFSAANGSAAFSTISFADSNGISFSSGTQGIYGTVRTDYASSNVTTVNLATSQSSLFQHTSATTAIVSDRALSTHSHGNPSLNLTNISGTTASASNGLTLSLSGNPSFGVSAGTQSVNSGTIVFSNSNGITFGMSGSSRITASHNGLTTAALSDHSHGNPSLALTNLSGTTASNSAGLTISLSAAAGGGGADGYNILGVNGASVGSAATLQLSNSNNVSFGVNGSTITATASYPAQTVQPVAFSAGNGSALFSTIKFADSNGLSFSTGTQGIYGTVKTDYAASNVTTNNLATSQSSLFQHTSGTTAIVSDRALSTHSHGNPTLALTNITGTTASASNGLTISLSAGAGGGGIVPVLSAGNGSASFTTLKFADSNGMSFSTGTQGVYGTVRTDYASSNVTTANIATSNSSLFQHTSATSAIVINRAWSTHDHGMFQMQLSNLTGNVSTASSGFTLSLTAANASGIALQNSETTFAGGTVSMMAGGALTIASVGDHTFRFSVPAISSLSGGDGITLTPSGNTISIVGNTNVAASTHTHGSPTLALTNISGTTASASNGLTLSLSAGAGGGGGAAISAGAASQSTGTVIFSNSNGVSFGLNAGTLTASHNGLTTAALSNHSHGNPTLALTNISGTTASNSAGLTLSLSAGAPGGGASPDRNIIEIIPGERLTTVAVMSATQFSQRPIFQPFWVDGTNVVCNTIRLLISGGASSNRSLVMTFGVALYSADSNKTRLTLLGSDSQAFSITASSQSSVWNGARMMDFTGMSSVTLTAEGRHVLALSCSAAGYNTTYANVMLYGGDPMPLISGIMVAGTTSATGSNTNIFPFWGVYSTTTAAFPASVAATQVLGGNSASVVDMYGVIREI